jgi:hypothetical protein
MTNMRLNGNDCRRRLRAARRKGQEVVEFGFIILPLFGFIFVTLDIAWTIFAQGTLQYAVRTGVRYGVTNQDVPGGSSLTAEIKNLVQRSSLGLLAGASGREKIKVHYYKPVLDEDLEPTGELLDVSGESNGNMGGNLMVVSVEAFSLAALFPRVSTKGVDNKPVIFSVEAADQIEPRAARPPIGSAP